MVLSRAFKPLSIVLGELNVGLHMALIQGLQKEQTATALMSFLRSLSALMSATSYDRLPSDLLPSALQVNAHFAGVCSDHERAPHPCFAVHPSTAGLNQSWLKIIIVHSQSTPCNCRQSQSIVNLGPHQRLRELLQQGLH